LLTLGVILRIGRTLVAPLPLVAASSSEGAFVATNYFIATQHHFAHYSSTTPAAAPAPAPAPAPQPAASGAHQVIGTAASERLDGTSGNDLIIGNGGDDVLVGHAGNDTFSAGAGTNQIWAYTDGWGGHPPPGWDPGAETFLFRVGAVGTTTIHTFDPAHNDTLRFADPTGHAATLAGLDQAVTVSNGPAADFDHRGDVTIAFKDGSGSVTLSNFFNIDNPLHEVHSMQDLSQYIHIDTGLNWFG
jgi:Ca2+-binding RTX toxin-like protein